MSTLPVDMLRYNLYSMNVYSFQLLCCRDHKSIKYFYPIEKNNWKIWRNDKKTQNVLINTINGCLTIHHMLCKNIFYIILMHIKNVSVCNQVSYLSHDNYDAILNCHEAIQCKLSEITNSK